MRWALTCPDTLIGYYSDEGLSPQALWGLVAIVEDIMPGRWELAHMAWEARREHMYATFREVAGFTFAPKLQISPNAAFLSPALSQRREPKDGIHGSLMNATSLCLLVANPPYGQRGPIKEIKTITNGWDPRFPSYR